MSKKIVIREGFINVQERGNGGYKFGTLRVPDARAVHSKFPMGGTLGGEAMVRREGISARFATKSI